MRALHATRFAATAPEPHAVHFRQTCSRTRAIERMLMQQHLRLVEQLTPASAQLAGRQMRMQIRAQRCFGRRERGQLRSNRQLQIPARRMRRAQLEAFIAEQRTQGPGQLGGGLGVERQLATGQHARHAEIGAHMRRIGAQPHRIGVVGNVDRACDGGHR